MKRLFFTLAIVVLSLLASCKKEIVEDNPTPKEPAISFGEISITETSATIAVKSENVNEVRLLFYATNEINNEELTFEKVMQEGVLLDSALINTQTQIEFNDLKEGTSYSIIAAATSQWGDYLSDVFSFQTKVSPEKPAKDYEYVAEREYASTSVKDNVTNIRLHLYKNSSETDYYPYADLYITLNDVKKYLPEGDYTIDGSKFFDEEGDELEIVSGTLKVSISDDEVYSLVLSGKLSTEKSLNITYEGKIKEFVVPGPDITHEVTFTKAVKKYLSSSEYQVELTDDSGKHILSIDFGWEGEENYIPEGRYTLDGEDGQTLIYKYSKYSYDDGPEYRFEKGYVDVQYSGEEYILDINVTTEKNVTVIGSYSGEIPDITPPGDVTYDLDIKISSAKYYIKDNMEPGEFYIKMNDVDWNYEIALSIFAEEGYDDLPAGTYTVGSENLPGTLSTKSYIDTYSPSYTSYYFKSGTLVVDFNEGIHTMTFTGVCESYTAEKKVRIKFSGVIGIVEF